LGKEEETVAESEPGTGKEIEMSNREGAISPGDVKQV